MTAVDEDVRARLEAEARRWVDGEADAAVAQAQEQLARLTAMVGQLRYELAERERSNDAGFLGLGERLANAETHIANCEYNIKGMSERLARVEMWVGAARWVGGLCIVYLAVRFGYEVWQAW